MTTLKKKKTPLTILGLMIIQSNTSGSIEMNLRKVLCKKTHSLKDIVTED